MIDDGYNLIKDFEDGAWRTKNTFKAYVDKVGAGQPITIGYGYTNLAGYGPGVKLGDVWTKKQAEDNLKEGVEIVWRRIKPFLKRTPTENQKAAIVSFVWNLGLGNFSGSTFLRRYNAGDIKGAAEALTWWNKGTVNGKKVVLPGLVRRRQAEKALFLREDK